MLVVPVTLRASAFLSLTFLFFLPSFLPLTSFSKTKCPGPCPERLAPSTQNLSTKGFCHPLLCAWLWGSSCLCLPAASCRPQATPAGGRCGSFPSLLFSASYTTLHRYIQSLYLYILLNPTPGRHVSPLPGCGRAVCRSLRHCLRFACVIFYPGSAPGWGSGRWCEAQNVRHRNGCSQVVAVGLENGDASSWLLVWLWHWGGGGGGTYQSSVFRPEQRASLPWGTLPRKG